jgi:hypothetical protein
LRDRKHIKIHKIHKHSRENPLLHTDGLFHTVALPFVLTVPKFLRKESKILRRDGVQTVLERYQARHPGSKGKA